MEAIITAGGCPAPKEPLYPLTQGGFKAMLPIAGKPMIRWVLEAVAAAPHVDQIVVVGLPAMDLLACSKPVTLVEDHGGLMDNIAAGAAAVLRLNPAAERTVLFSSDIPALTPLMVEWMIEQVQASDHEVWYTVIERSVMEASFPGSRRTYTHLKNLELCGGDVVGLDPRLTQSDHPLFVKLSAARKSPVRQAALLGFDTLFLLLLRQLALSEAERLISRRLGVRGRALLTPYAAMGMDVDKPNQYELLKAALEPN